MALKGKKATYAAEKCAAAREEDEAGEEDEEDEAPVKKGKGVAGKAKPVAKCKGKARPASDDEESEDEDEAFESDSDDFIDDDDEEDAPKKRKRKSAVKPKKSAAEVAEEVDPWGIFKTVQLAGSFDGKARRGGLRTAGAVPLRASPRTGSG